MSDSVKYLLDETQIPKRWYNLTADLPSPPPPVLHPGTLQPVGPDDLAPLFPMSLIMQEVAHRARDRDSRSRSATSTGNGARARCFARAASRQALADAGAHLLQVRGREPGRQPQAEHGGRAGVLQQGSRRHARSAPKPAPASGDRRSRSRARCSASRFTSSWCACRTTRSPTGARSWRRLARAASRAPRSETSFGRQVLASHARQQRQPRHRDLRGGRSRRRPRRHQLRARLGAESCAAASDGHRPGSDRADGDGQRLPGHRRRLHGRRVELRRHRLPVHRRATARRQESRASSRSSQPRARASRAAATRTTSATPAT